MSGSFSNHGVKDIPQIVEGKLKAYRGSILFPNLSIRFRSLQVFGVVSFIPKSWY